MQLCQLNLLPEEIDSTTLLSAMAAIGATPFAGGSEAIDAHLALIKRFLAVGSVCITQFNDSTLKIVAASSTGWGPTVGSVIPLEETLCQYVRATKAPLRIGDARQDARMISPVRRHYRDIRSYLAVPLVLSDGRQYGTLCALDSRPRHFGRSQVDLLRVVAGQVATIIERDESARATYRAECELDAALERLDEQSALLKMVVHDIRTPLNSIQGFAEMMQIGAFGPLSEEQHEVLGLVRQAGMFINRLANGLLDVLSAKAQPLKLRAEVFDPADLARQVLETCRPQAVRQGLALHFRDDSKISSIVGDPDRIREILFNLMSNALHYTMAGSITLAVEGSADAIEFQVKDTGHGISDEMQQVIWDAHTRGVTQRQGWGLGLYVVRRLAEMMGGQVGVSSAPGAGSTFWIRLPRQDLARQVGGSTLA